MKKSVLMLIIGVFCLAFGIVLYKTQNNGEIVYITYSSPTLTKEEATSLVNDTVKNIISFYENKEEIFEVTKAKDESEEEKEAKEGTEDKSEVEIPDGYIRVTNYDDIVKGMFTENGIKELEETMFEKKKYVLKDEENVFLLDKLPEDNQFKDYNITLGVIEIEEEEINCEVTLSTNKMDDDDKMLAYYVIEKNLRLIKDKDGWLIDTFAYNNV